MSVCSGCQHDVVCKYKKQVQKYEKREQRERSVPEPLRPEIACRYKLTGSGWYYPIYPTWPTTYEPYRITCDGTTGDPLPDPLYEVTCDTASVPSSITITDYRSGDVDVNDADVIDVSGHTLDWISV